MNIGLYLQLLVIGLSMGMIYAILPWALYLVRAVGVLNFAQGELFMLSAYVCYALTVQLHAYLRYAYSCPFNLRAVRHLVYVAVYWPLRNSKWPATIISTLGASVVLKGWSSSFGVQCRSFSRLSLRACSCYQNVRIEYQYLFIIGIGSLLITAVFLLFDKLFLSRAMQAAAQDSYAAQLWHSYYHNGTYLYHLCFAVGWWLVGIAIILVSTSLGSFYLRAFRYGYWGLGDVKGAVIGSLLVGVIESFSRYLLPPTKML